MGTEEQFSREERAARNEALFRAVNDGARTLNEGFASITGEFAILCECADTVVHGDPGDRAARLRRHSR